MKKICDCCGKSCDVLSWETTCFSCRKKNYYNKLVEQIQNGEADATDCEDDIICPWCGEIYDDYESRALYEDGSHECECWSCEKEFKVTTTVSYSYDTERM